MDKVEQLNAFKPPPDHLKAVYKYCHDLSPSAVESEAGIVDFSIAGDSSMELLDGCLLASLFKTFLHGEDMDPEVMMPAAGAAFYASDKVPGRKLFFVSQRTHTFKGVYISLVKLRVFLANEMSDIKLGLLIFPGLFPPLVQKNLISRLLDRDLSDSRHQTNLHLHYNVKYPENGKSFFSEPKMKVLFEPKDPSVHKPLTTEQALGRKLRWITLGGQYDWTKKIYPEGAPPKFPRDIRNLVFGLFDGKMEPQAAIVNIYTPGDTLSLHRDVSEEVKRGLVSISLGCDCIFLIGLDCKSEPKVPWTEHPQLVALRLKSGDAVYMGGMSRYAWHGVPKIIPHTAPAYLADFSGETNSSWKGYMSNKRINLNIRQMREGAL